jgi:hypothetical protein
VDPDLILPPFLAAAGLLVVTGAAKLRSPGGVAAALAGARLPSSRGLARALGALELGVGAAALLAPRALAAPVALLYLAFAAFILRALTSGFPVPSCGCLGERETPPSAVHAVLDALAAACAVLVLLSPVPSTATFLGGQPWSGVPLAALVAVGVVLASTALAHLPAALASWRPEPEAETR